MSLCTYCKHPDDAHEKFWADDDTLLEEVCWTDQDIWTKKDWNVRIICDCEGFEYGGN